MKAKIGTFAFALAMLPLAATAQKAPSPKPAPSAAAPAPDMAKLQQLIQQMRAQMETLRTTTDPAERQRLLADHMKLMQEQMRMMRGTEAPMTTAGGMAGHDDGGMPATAPRSRARLIEDRLDMLEMVLEQVQAHMMELARDVQSKK